jgi:hypothetical protein
MTRQEAEQYLAQQNYCPTHFIEKVKEQHNAYGDPYYYCQKCVEENKRIRREKIQEAIKVLNG